MKHLKTYENINLHKIEVSDIIEQYGDEETAKFLDILLKGKEVKNVFIINAYTGKSINNLIGIVRKVFYLNSSHFIVIQLDDEGQERYILTGRTEIFCEDPNIKEAQLFIDSKKFNL